MGDCVSSCKGKGDTSLNEEKKASIRQQRNSVKTPSIVVSSEDKQNQSPAQPLIATSKRNPLIQYYKNKAETDKQLRKDLEVIFLEYDVDKDGKLSVLELRRMVNVLHQKKTGVENRFSLRDMTQFMSMVDRRGEMDITLDEFYDFYKKW